VTDAGLKELGVVKTSLPCGSTTECDDAGVEELQKMLPKCNIRVQAANSRTTRNCVAIPMRTGHVT